MYSLCAAGVERVLLGLFLISRAVIHRLYSRAEEGVEEGAGEAYSSDQEKVSSRQWASRGKQNRRQRRKQIQWQSWMQNRWSRSSSTIAVKAFASPDDWSQRRDAGGLVETYVRANFDGGARVAVLGDWNDDVDVSIVSGFPTPYTNFNADPGTFRFLTAPLSAAGISSTVTGPLAVGPTVRARGT